MKCSEGRSLALISAALLLATIPCAAQEPVPNAERTKQIRDLTKQTGVGLSGAAISKELKAPDEVKVKLDEARAKLLNPDPNDFVGGKPTFNVGYTNALTKPERRKLGLVIPSDAKNKVPAQNKQTAENLAREEKIQAALKSVLPQRARLQSTRGWGCSPQAKSFDWRTKGAVTRAKDQNPCGSCWAFAAVAALEGSYFVTNRVAMVGAEQQVLDCSRGGDCDGGMYDVVWDNLQGYGTADMNDYPPYLATEASCRWSKATPFHWAAWGWVDEADPYSLASTEKIKDALCQRGPLATAMVASTLGFDGYQPGHILNENVPEMDLDHAVTIVGWDDEKQAWLVKNSWGEDYGDNGFLWVRYGANKIGSWTAWVQARKQVSLDDDCETFGARGLTIEQRDGRWKVMSGRHTIADTNQSREDAERVIKVVSHYKLSKQCYLGRPDWHFEYFLAGRKTPRDELAGEQCMKFNLASLDVDKDGDRWQLKDGIRRVKTFDKEVDAWMAYAYMRRHEFTYSCTVGEGFTYYRH